jgi:hypothetical protein
LDHWVAKLDDKAVEKAVVLMHVAVVVAVV